MTVRVVVADDQDLVRTGLAMILDAQPGIDVVGEASDGAEAVMLARRLRPDVCLLDISMPKMTGIEVTTALAGPEIDDPIPIVIITTFDLDEYVYGALRAGASGFLLKDARPRELLRAIEVVAAGDALIDPGITRRLIGEFASRRDPSEPPAALAELTDREREVMELVAHGLSNAEIAGRLVISPLTAKTHVSNVLRKLGCRDRAALVALAYESGLVVPGEPA